MTEDLWPKQTEIDFFRWLTEEGKSPGTAAGYAGHVRRTIRRLGREPDPDAFAEYLNALPSGPRNMVRTAWRSWAAYALTQGVEVALPPTRDRGRPEAAPSPLDTFAHAFLGYGIHPTDLATMRWLDLKAGVSEVTVSDPGRHRTWQVPKALVLALKEHYFGPGMMKPSAFLFADADGSPWEPHRLIRAASRVATAVQAGKARAWTPPAT